MGMNITNCLKLFRYGFKRYRCDNFIGISEFSERLAIDWFSNPFTTDTGTPAKSIPSFDDIDEKFNVSTCLSLKYSSFYCRNSEISTILDITIATDTTNDIGHTDLKEVEN